MDAAAGGAVRAARQWKSVALACAALAAALALAWFIEGWRARLWAEEMRKAGVTAPAEVR